ncbi:DUF4397 domain-containing protein [Marinobacter sp. 1-3A]|uniref:DUF4397 domain-containing protein n=1 Tax=Marinobacter sp. 1-3A TaxID=2582920 RepID=UPI0019058640|nr:DUF4397 domain-containing protein [Marinobacter sp. 1-3A]MBK1872772.1 DUF4397 domain-containing protein [Marinobacter sp. 1-3A]
MKTKVALTMALAASAMLVGCSDNDNDSVTQQPTSKVRAVHAASDAPAVNVLVDGSPAISGAEFKQAAVISPTLGTYALAVEAILPGGSTTTVIDPTDVTLEDGFDYDVIAVGEVGNIDALILADDGSRTDANAVRLRVAHLSPAAQAAAAGPVDVYVTAFGAELPPEANFSFSFKESIGPLELPANDYQIRVTPAGSGTVVFDSGKVSLQAGTNLLIGAVDNTGANGDASPISLVVLNGGDVAEIYDTDQAAGVRVVHASSDAPNVDVYVDGQSTPLADIAFGSVAPFAFLDGYAALPAGDARIQVAAAGTGLGGGLVVIDETLPLVNGQGYTALAVGQLAGIEALVVEDQVRSIATQASLRIIHASTQAGNVDIYLVPGTQSGIGNFAPALSNVPFKAVTDYLAVADGTYNVYITPTGTGTVAISAEGVELNAGDVYTAVARDADPGEQAPLNQLGLILFDNFVVPQP